MLGTRRVRLNFFRDDPAVVFGRLQHRPHLPAFKKTTIEFTPHRSGEFTFACGMNMICGKLVVQ